MWRVSSVSVWIYVFEVFFCFGVRSMRYERLLPVLKHSLMRIRIRRCQNLFLSPHTTQQTNQKEWGPTEWGPIPFLPDSDLLVRRLERQWGDLDK